MPRLDNSVLRGAAVGVGVAAIAMSYGALGAVYAAASGVAAFGATYGVDKRFFSGADKPAADGAGAAANDSAEADSYSYTDMFTKPVANLYNRLRGSAVTSEAPAPTAPNAEVAGDSIADRVHNRPASPDGTEKTMLNYKA